MPTDYKKGQIYKLWTLESDEIYIGSTTQPLYKRLSVHKNASNKCNSKILFERYGNIKIELIEAFPCDNIEELNRREGHFQRLNKEFIVNRNIAGRTNKEYYIDNADKISEYYKEYYTDNTDKILERNKLYTIKNAKKINEYQKEYNIKHVEKRNEYSRQYQRQHRADKKALAKI